MITNFFPCLFLITLSFQVIAKEIPDPETDASVTEHTKNVTTITSGPKKCPDKSKLISLCSSVSGMVRDKDPDSDYVHQYERKIYEASCVDISNDSPEEVSRKVNIMWNKYGDELVCNSPRFDTSNGSVLKFAVSQKFREFIVDAAQVWKINLNKIDDSDGKTLLDYTRDQLERNKSNANESILRQYYEVLKKAGAKHRNEL